MGSYLSGLDKYPEGTLWDDLIWQEQVKEFKNYRLYLEKKTEQVRYINNLILSGLGIGDINGSLIDIEKELWRREKIDFGLGLYD